MQQNKYKLSPSDFKYLWEECSHCFWRKVHYGEIRPSIGIPSVFNKMSSLLQRSIIGERVESLVDGMQPGVFVQEEGRLMSKPLPSGKSFIAGRFDLLTKFDDGSFGVIDLKITEAKDKDLEKFGRQLHAYKYALENPAYGQEPKNISRIGLLVLSPTDIRPHNGFVYYKARPKWKEIKIDMDNFFNFIYEVEDLLSRPEPKPSRNCDWCRYRYKL